MPEPGTQFFSLATTQQLVPDVEDYDSTVQNFEDITGACEGDPVWSLAKIAVAEIDPYQLIDDPDDDCGLAKVGEIRAVMRSGGFLPPVYAIHQPDHEYPYNLIEGRHRYNAAHAEQAELLLAWVGHVPCTCRRKAASE